MNDTENYWLRQELLPEADLPGIKKFIIIEDTELRAKYSQITIDAYIQYLNEDNKDVTSKYKSRIDGWIINNYTSILVRDQAGNPVANPEYNPQTNPDVDQFLKKPRFDYFKSLIKQGVDLITLLSSHIKIDDANGDFNF